MQNNPNSATILFFHLIFLVMSETVKLYNKSCPFLARIKERYNLCKKGSQKSTYHVVLDLEGSGMTYQVGDSLGVLPENDLETVQKILDLLHTNGDEIIVDKRTQELISLEKFLTHKANLAEVPKKLIVEMTNRQTNHQKKNDWNF